MKTLGKFLLAAFLMTVFLGNASAKEDGAPLRLPVPSSKNEQFILLLDAKTHAVLDTPKFVSVTAFQKVGDALIARAKRKGGKTGYIDKNGTWLSKEIFDSARAFSEDDIARVEVDGKWGFIKADGSFLIKPSFYFVSPFRKGLAAVQLKKKGPYHYINLQAKKVFNKVFAKAGAFSENGFAPIVDNNILDPFDKLIKKFVRGASISKRSRGFINTQGEVVIEPRFKKIKPFNKFGVAIAKNYLGDYGLINEKGKWISKPKYEFFWDYSESGVAWVREPGYKNFEGYVDTKGKEIWKASYHDFWGESNGLLVNHRDGFQYYDPFGKLVIKDKSTWASNFSDAKAAIALREQWGILSRDGNFKPFDEMIVAPLTDKYDSVWGFYDGGIIPMVTKDGGIHYFDREGKVIFTFNVNDKNKLSLRNSEGKELYQQQGEPYRVHAFLAEGEHEHFRSIADAGDGILDTVEQLLHQKAKKYYIPNPIYGAHGSDATESGPYKIDPDDGEEVKNGAIKIIAQTYVSPESWATYYFLISDHSKKFWAYEKRLVETISAKYDLPLEDENRNVHVWKINGKKLSLTYDSDSGDGDYYHQIYLEVNSAEKNSFKGGKASTKKDDTKKN